MECPIGHNFPPGVEGTDEGVCTWRHSGSEGSGALTRRLHWPRQLDDSTGHGLSSPAPRVGSKVIFAGAYDDRTTQQGARPPRQSGQVNTDFQMSHSIRVCFEIPQISGMVLRRTRSAMPAPLGVEMASRTLRLRWIAGACFLNVPAMFSRLESGHMDDDAELPVVFSKTHDSFDNIPRSGFE